MTASENEAARMRWLDTRWKTGVLLGWLALSALLLLIKWPDIAALSLGDTDDNLRFAQVQAWLAGQPWYDLRQYDLAPPLGADIHWSRLPDLPIAGLIVLLRPLLGAAGAEQWALALAPLIPFAIGLFALAFTVRNIVEPRAWPFALLITLCAIALVRMWMPMRLDHHGWQLALLALAVAGLTDPNKRRGGLVTGLATALSLSIGLEMLAYLALAGAAVTFFWIYDRAEATRLAAYGVSLGAGTAVGFAVFASNANRAAVCDALSPVWLSAMVLAGAFLVLLSLVRAEDLRIRIGLATAAGAVIAGAFAVMWPECLSRPEGVSAELDALWLSNVREAKPITVQNWQPVLALIALPLSGFAGYAIALRKNRGTRIMPALIAITALALAGFLLLFWQVRLGPSAHLLAIPGAVALGWYIMPVLRRSNIVLARVGGTLVTIALMTGLYVAPLLIAFPVEPDTTRDENSANTEFCFSSESLAVLGALPQANFLTHIDLSPRLIAMTHHRAVAGPYHRNGDAILDVLQAFRQTPERARETVERYQIDYVLLCPGMPEAGRYSLDDERNFFAMLDEGNPPEWLEPVTLPEDSPFRLWRVR